MSSNPKPLSPVPTSGGVVDSKRRRDRENRKSRWENPPSPAPSPVSVASSAEDPVKIAAAEAIKRATMLAEAALKKSTQTQTTTHGTDAVKMSTEEAVRRATMLALAAKSNTTPVSVNQGNVYIEQQKAIINKRKMIWGNKKAKVEKETESFNQWEKSGFDGEDANVKRQKFLKLMGMSKGKEKVLNDQDKPQGNVSSPNPATEVVADKEQSAEEISIESKNDNAPDTPKALTELERQYEESRRRQYGAIQGRGLGF